MGNCMMYQHQQQTAAQHLATVYQMIVGRSGHLVHHHPMCQQVVGSRRKVVQCPNHCESPGSLQQIVLMVVMITHLEK